MLDAIRVSWKSYGATEKWRQLNTSRNRDHQLYCLGKLLPVFFRPLIAFCLEYYANLDELLSAPDGGLQFTYKFTNYFSKMTVDSWSFTRHVI